MTNILKIPQRNSIPFSVVQLPTQWASTGYLPLGVIDLLLSKMVSVIPSPKWRRMVLCKSSMWCTYLRMCCAYSASSDFSYTLCSDLEIILEAPYRIIDKRIQNQFNDYFDLYYIIFNFQYSLFCENNKKKTGGEKSLFSVELIF